MYNWCKYYRVQYNNKSDIIETYFTVITFYHWLKEIKINSDYQIVFRQSNIVRSVKIRNFYSYVLYYLYLYYTIYRIFLVPAIRHIKYVNIICIP